MNQREIIVHDDWRYIPPDVTEYFTSLSNFHKHSISSTRVHLIHSFNDLK